jgi:hypothetical protein
MRFQKFSPSGELIQSVDLRILQDARDESLNNARLHCKTAIIMSGLDEATQQNAALGIYPPERCESIKSYIAACRNEYLRCKELIFAAQTNDEADAVQFVAPPVPEGI